MKILTEIIEILKAGIKGIGQDIKKELSKIIKSMHETSD